MKEIISLTLTEIHNHLRATDDKRDKLANLYFILVLAALSTVFALHDKDVEPTLDNTVFFIVLIIFVFLECIGYLVIRSEFNSRKWHAEYMNCSILVQGLFRYLKYANIIIPYRVTHGKN